MMIYKALEILSVKVEADETFVGGKNKNRHKDKKVSKPHGRRIKGKIVIFGVAPRSGKINAVVLTL